MKYRVRSKEGELEYQSFGQVEQAWLMGLVEPEDEILEEGKTLWRKAGSIPLLANARRHGDDVWGGTWFIWALIGVAGGSLSLWFFNNHAWSWQMRVGAGLSVAVGVSMLMWKITKEAQKRRNPHRRER